MVTGGHRLDRKGYFVHPTVLTNVDPATCGCSRRRSSAPWSRSCRSTTTTKRSPWPTTRTYGLAATAWTKNLGRAHRLAKRLKAGTVGLNCQLVFDHAMPFGGYKQSGWGYEFGQEGIEAYLKTKSVWAQL